MLAKAGNGQSAIPGCFVSCAVFFGSHFPGADDLALGLRIVQNHIPHGWYVDAPGTGVLDIDDRCGDDSFHVAFLTAAEAVRRSRLWPKLSGSLPSDLRQSRQL